MQSILLGTVVALIVGLVVTPWVIDIFRARGIGKFVREYGPATHLVKHGTPTMGGFVLLFAATVGYVLAHVRFIRGGVRLQGFAPAAMLVLAVGWALGLLGAADDIIQIRRRRSLGLNKRAKLAGQAVVGFGLAYLAVHWAGISSSLSWTGTDLHLPWAIPTIVFAVWVLLLIAAESNAVNFTDGLDGLASGSAAMCFFVFTIIGFWEFRNPQVYPQLSSQTASGLLDVAIVSAAFLGACIGFLWWNAAPARIILGDTGSLALGGALATLAIFTRTQLLLAVIGGLFVIITLSVVIQVTSYRLFGGRRVFAMAPLHHHFELRGWAEFTVIVRFWLIAALVAGLGLALFYMAFLASGGVS
jgi:phospho-N-acetylmuramoyl-pentapeptide-transferase